MRNYDTPWQCLFCTQPNVGGAHPVDDPNRNPHRCVMCEAPRPRPPREVVPHVLDDNVIPTVGGDEQSFTCEFRGIDNDDDQFNLDAAIAASLECSAKHDHDNNDPNVSQRVMSNAQGLDPNAFPSTPPSTPPTTASSTSGNVNALDRSRVRQSP